MKNSFRKLIPLVAAIGLTFAGTSAHAFDLKDGAGTTLSTGSTTLDWSASGSGVAKGVGPFGTPLTVGQNFQFLYQANLATVDGDQTIAFNGLDNTANGSAGAGKNFEFTIVAKLNETVTGISGNQATFGVGAGSNKVAIYYDTKSNANTTAGTGFDDGTLIALLTIVPDGTESNFTVSASGNGGLGSTKMRAIISETGDFIDADYLAGVSELLFGVNFESNLNYPAGNSYTTNFHQGGSDLFGDYTAGANDIIFKVDGSTTLLANAVPEPGSIMLLGMGMLGLVGATRRRRAPKA